MYETRKAMRQKANLTKISWRKYFCVQFFLQDIDLYTLDWIGLKV